MSSSRTECVMSSYFTRFVHMWYILPSDLHTCASFDFLKEKMLLFSRTNWNLDDVFALGFTSMLLYRFPMPISCIE